MKNSSHYWYLTGEMLFVFRRERDTDLRDRGGGESSSMSASTSEERERNLFPVFTTPWGFEIELLFIFVVFRSWLEFLLTFSVCLLMFVGEICLSVIEPVNPIQNGVYILVEVSIFISREGIFDNDKGEDWSFIQKSGVWHSTDFCCVERTALAYDEGAGVGEGDGALTSRLASSFVSFSAFTRRISFSRIQTRHWRGFSTRNAHMVHIVNSIRFKMVNTS